MLYQLVEGCITRLGKTLVNQGEFIPEGLFTADQLARFIKIKKVIEISEPKVKKPAEAKKPEPEKKQEEKQSGKSEKKSDKKAEKKKPAPTAPSDDDDIKELL